MVVRPESCVSTAQQQQNNSKMYTVVLLNYAAWERFAVLDALNQILVIMFRKALLRSMKLKGRGNKWTDQ